MSYFDENEIIEIGGFDSAKAQNVDAEELETTTPYLVCLVTDGSGSMCDYDRSGAMSDCIANFKKEVLGSKQADEMLISRIDFDDVVRPRGFVKPEDVDTDYRADGCTALYDAIAMGSKLITDYMRDLVDAGSNPRGCLVILSDGHDNASNISENEAKKLIEELGRKEVIVAFIAFGDAAKGIANRIGVRPQNIKEVQSTKGELRRMLNVVSKSAISASRRCSTGESASAGFFDV